MLFVDVMAINHIVVLALQLLKHRHHFFRRILTVIVEYRDVSTARITEPSEDGAVLAKIPAEMHERHILRKFLGQFYANHFAVILGAVIYQNNLEGGGRENRCDALDKRTDCATAVVNWDHQRYIRRCSLRVHQRILSSG